MKLNCGFTLMESLVALVILSVTFSVVWEWFGVAVTSTQKIERVVAYPEVFELFVNRLSAESLQHQREGEYAIGHYTVSWQAEPIRQSSEEINNRQPAWEVALFTVNATILMDGTELSSFTTLQTNYWQADNDIKSIFGM